MPEADNWRIAVPLAALTQPGVVAGSGSGDVTAKARQLADGRWSIEVTAVPATLALARSMDSGATRRLELRCASQSGTATIDPALRLRSRLFAEAHGVSELTTDGSASATLDVGEVRDLAAWQVLGGTGLQLDEHQSIDGLRFGLLAGRVAFTTSVGHVDIGTTSQDADVARVARGYWLPPVLYAALSEGLTHDISALAGGNSRSRRSSDQMLNATEASRNLGSLGPTSFDIAMRGLLLEMGNVAATADTGRAFLSWGAPDGVADAKFGAALDHIVVASTSKSTPLPSVLPRSVAIAIHASGLPAREAADVMRRLIASGGKPGRDLQRDIPVLLDKGPLVIALDSFSLQAGPARLDARATLKVIRPRLIEGTAQMAVSGLDAFIARAKTDAKLARIVPALIYGRGLGEHLGSGDMRWDVTLASGHVVVNGLDVWPPAKPLSTPPG